jgi:hypothetical protein
MEIVRVNLTCRISRVAELGSEKAKRSQRRSNVTRSAVVRAALRQQPRKVAEAPGCAQVDADAQEELA